MKRQEYIDLVEETSDIDVVNELLEKNWIILATYIKRTYGDYPMIFETLVYSMGRYNKDRFFTLEITDNL